MKPKWKGFGVFLKQERQRAQIERFELAERLNKKASTVVSWELGYRRPKQQSLLALSNIFGAVPRISAASVSSRGCPGGGG